MKSLQPRIGQSAALFKDGGGWGGGDFAFAPERIAGVEEARRSLEFATEREIDADYAKHGA